MHLFRGFHHLNGFILYDLNAYLTETHLNAFILLFEKNEVKRI